MITLKYSRKMKKHPETARQHMQKSEKYGITTNPLPNTPERKDRAIKIDMKAIEKNAEQPQAATKEMNISKDPASLFQDPALVKLKNLEEIIQKINHAPDPPSLIVNKKREIKVDLAKQKLIDSEIKM